MTTEPASRTSPTLGLGVHSVLTAAAIVLLFTALINFKPPQTYITDTNSSSHFSHGLAYFWVEQSDPKAHAVKKLSVFHKMITETCQQTGKVIINVIPCGPGVMIEGEIAYSAMLVTYGN